MYSDPKIKEAFTKAIKHYFDGHGLDEYDKVSGGARKFDKKYFDTLENDLTGEKPKEEPKKKKKKSDPFSPKSGKGLF